MGKNMKKVSAILMAGAMLVSALPVSAGSKTQYGHTMNYSKEKLSDTKAQAVTTWLGVNSVKATVRVNYNSSGQEGVNKSASNSSREATVATITLVANSYINTVSGIHSAEVTYQGKYEEITGVS